MQRALHRADDFEATLLREFLAVGDGFVSGAALAKRLGVSRVAVWAHLRRLQEDGFAFTAVPSRGYRLDAQPSRLSAPFIRALLAPDPAAAPALLHFPSVDSTNEEASRQLATGRPAPFVVLAAEQTQGRGRFGRAWHSPAAGNLYVSFGFRPSLPPERMHLFTLWMGLNLCELIAALAGRPPGLKWPNDLYFGDLKVGGMLTEARIDADRIRDLVFGLGLNVNAPPAALPREVGRTATSLAQETGATHELNRVAAATIGRVLGAYERFTASAALPEVADLWHRYDLLAGRHIVVVQGTHRHAGVARGIDNEGALLLRTDSGRTLRFRAGEVTLQKNG